jgi:hypothetical protein
MKQVQKQEQVQEQNQQLTLTGGDLSDHLGVQADTRERQAKSTRTQPGKFPKSTTTLRALVLATMLAGDDVSGMESVFFSGSTKLATVMRALTRRYRWPIECREFPTNAPGGQVVWVSMYVIPAAAIVSAFGAGAETWIGEVREASSKRLAAPTRRAPLAPFGSTTNEPA